LFFSTIYIAFTMLARTHSKSGIFVPRVFEE